MFKPNGEFLKCELMKIQYKNVLNENNIALLSAFRIARILKNEMAKDKDVFLHFLISKWVDAEENKGIDFIKSIKHLIRKTKITMSEVDKYELVLLEERSFSEYRHIKILEVSTFLINKEFVGIKFVNAQLYEKNKQLSLLKDVTLMISNKRIILEDSKMNIESFFWDKIKSFSYQNYGFEFTHINKKYVLRIHDQVTLNNTLRNMISKRIRSVAKKESKTL